MNKSTKIAVIVASVLAGLLAVALIAVLIAGGKIGEKFDLKKMFGKESSTAEITTEEASPAESSSEKKTSTAAPTKATKASTAAPTETETETVPPTTEEETVPVQRQKRTLRIGVQKLSGKYIQLYAEDDGDKTINGLTQVNLLVRDRAGKAVLNGIEGEVRSYNGTDYAYSGIADIGISYDAEADLTTYTVKIRDDIRFSDGVKMTIDDVIFNYYLRLQPGYDGIGNLRSYDILGLDNYYYNNSEAEDQSVSDEEVASELEDPGEDVQNYIRNLIATTLRQEADSCKKIWATYQPYGYGNSAEELFWNLYGISLNYNPTDKKIAEMCEDLIEMYGLDYRALGEHYAIDAHFFDDDVATYAREVLLYNKIRSVEGDPVDSISGILRMGSYSMKLKVRGFDENAVYDLFDIDVLPMHYYGDDSLYDYNSHLFGFNRIAYSIPEEKLSAPVGAGPFIYERTRGNSILMIRNDDYYGGEIGAEFLQLTPVGNDALGYISEGVVDLTVVPGTKNSFNTICAANSNEKLIGNKLVARNVDVMGYAYIGINAANVKVGDDPYSEESRNLRRGLAVILSAYRDIAYEEYFGSSVSLIDYPVSNFYNVTPSKLSPSYQVAFNQDINGKEIISSDMSVATRYAKVAEAAKEYFLKAGYVMGSDGKFSAAPKGASLLYGVTICGDEYSYTVHPSREAITYAKSVLYSMGITLDIHYQNTEESMLVALYTGNCELWCASWTSDSDPDLMRHYLGTGRTNDMGPNLYGIAYDPLDELLYQAEKAETATERNAKYMEIFEMVRSLAIELPCYQLYNYYVFNAQTLKLITIPAELTYFHDWLDEIESIEVNYRE